MYDFHVVRLCVALVHVFQLDLHIYAAAPGRLDPLTVFDNTDVKEPRIAKHALIDSERFFGPLLEDLVCSGLIIRPFFLQDLRDFQLRVRRDPGVASECHGYFVIMAVACKDLLFDRRSHDAVDRELLRGEFDRFYSLFRHSLLGLQDLRFLFVLGQIDRETVIEGIDTRLERVSLYGAISILLSRKRHAAKCCECQKEEQAFHLY